MLILFIFFFVGLTSHLLEAYEVLASYLLGLRTSKGEQLISSLVFSISTTFWFKAVVGCVSMQNVDYVCLCINSFRISNEGGTFGMLSSKFSRLVVECLFFSAIAVEES